MVSHSLIAALLGASLVSASSKRGLCYTPNDTTIVDDAIWVSKPSVLSWYYNYQPTPSEAYQNISQDKFEFVPMLWGKPEDEDGTVFLDTIKELIKEGTNITHVLTFNEPEAPWDWGGSNMDAEVAAKVWVNNIEPLRKMGIRVGLPSPTAAPAGLEWIQDFLQKCAVRLTGDKKGAPKKNCTFDFITLHWYDNFEGLASHMGTYTAAFPNKTMWITEYNYAHQDLATTQAFYKMSAEYFDRLDFVERYSLFGAFRSGVSNVGPNAAMLNNDGNLTDIGAWYLGRDGTGVDPQSGNLPGARRPNSAASSSIGGSQIAVMGAVVAAAAVALLGVLGF